VKNSNKNPSAEKIIIEVMRFYGFRRNYQVAEYFNVTPQTLSGWIKSGEIPPKHLIKYKTEVLDAQDNKNVPLTPPTSIYNISDLDKELIKPYKFSWNKTKETLLKNLRILLVLPLTVISLTMVYVFFIANPVYTSISKVLPISEDGSGSNGFSGMAAQLGINIPLNIGGTVPWDEIYPEIVKSSDLLLNILSEEYDTKKYGNKSLREIIINEHSLSKYKDQDNRALIELRQMIEIIKDRLSPVVTLKVSAFEPLFSAQLSNRLIQKSGEIQRQLKTNRVRKKRLFIEERLVEVSSEMKNMEKELREFREYNRNISSSPSLTMKVQEMGREIDLQNSLYVTLKTQHEKAKIDEVERDDMVQVIDGPSIPAKLTRPRRGLGILLSAFFGFFMTIFYIYFRENFMEINGS